LSPTPFPLAAALFGYLLPGDRPEHWGADHLIETPAQLLFLRKV